MSLSQYSYQTGLTDFYGFFMDSSGHYKKWKLEGENLPSASFIQSNQLLKSHLDLCVNMDKINLSKIK